MVIRTVLLTAAFVFGSSPLQASAFAHAACRGAGSGPSDDIQPDGNAASTECVTDLASVAVSINLSPDFQVTGGASGRFTIADVCWPPDWSDPSLAGCPFVYGAGSSAYFEAGVTAWGYTEGPPRPGFMVFEPDDEWIFSQYGISPEQFYWSWFELEQAVATVGPYSLGLSYYAGDIDLPPYAACMSDGPAGASAPYGTTLPCGHGFALPFPLGVPFQVSSYFRGHAGAEIRPGTYAFQASAVGTRFRFYEASEVVPAHAPFPSDWFLPAPGATPVPAYLVPEPSSLWLLGLGVALVLGARGRKRAKLE